jgi:Transposase DDE domain
MVKVNSQVIGTGGFYVPVVYKKNQKNVEIRLKQGEIDYADLTSWTFPDEFLCFVLKCNLLKFIDSTYPNPRLKNEVPVWFLICCQFVMHLYQTGKYNHLQFLLNSGSLLTRFGFNVGTSKIGFNEKNKKTRKTVIHADTVRKFFKDANHNEIRDWYRTDLQSWFRIQHAFDHQGIFILDQTHLVVPDNENYRDAVKMPVDEHGQLYSNLCFLTEEQKKALIYHPCYSLSTLLNVSMNCSQFHIANYELGAGNEDELVQAEKLIPYFCRKFPCLMKLLIVDRGYIQKNFIEKIKNDYNVDVLIPLRKNMDDYKESIALAKMKNNWQIIEEKYDPSGKILIKKEIASTNNLELWCDICTKMNSVVTRYTSWNPKNQTYDENYAVLISTRKYSNPKLMIMHYELRVQTEERFRQFKHGWYISEFPSPHASLVESHVCFTLLTYSLLQLYLRREDLKEKTHQMISTLRADERLGKDAVLVYASNEYGVFDLDDYTVCIAGLQDTPRQRLIKIMQAQKEARMKREQ